MDKMDIDDVVSKIDDLAGSHSMPKRLKIVLDNVGEELKNKNYDTAVRVTSAIYELEDVTSDINIPMHAKTAIWDVISNLEAIKHEEE